MSELQSIENHITELLGQHPCVVIPEFGAFLMRDAAASANPFSGEVKPSGQTLFFNPSITADDGLLAAYIKEKEGCDYATALSSIKNNISDIRARLQKNKNCPFGKLGNFFLHTEGNVLFLPLSGLNLSKKAFGLGTLHLNELTQQQSKTNQAQSVNAPRPAVEIQFTEEVLEEAAVIDIQTGRTRSRGFIWKVAAAACFISMGAAVLYYSQTFLATNSKLQVASQIPSATSQNSNAGVTKEDYKATTNKNTAPSISLLSPSDMNVHMEQIKNGEGLVFVCGGSYMSDKLATNECNTWKKMGIPAVIGKKHGSSLLKVVLGRFSNEEAASTFLQQMPINSGFHAGLLTADLLFL